MTICCVTAHTFKAGDSVRFRKSNKFRHVIKEVLSDTTMRIEEFVQTFKRFC